jgi:hypothetical protein
MTLDVLRALGCRLAFADSALARLVFQCSFFLFPKRKLTQQQDR